MRLLALLALTAAAALGDPAVPSRVLPKIAFTLADFEAQTPKSEAGNFMMEIPEIVNLSRSAGARAVLVGKSVEFTGQVQLDATNPNRFRAWRSLMPCCVAHVQRFEIAVECDSTASSLKDGVWVKLVGTIAFREENGALLPVVISKQIHETPQPANPLLK